MARKRFLTIENKIIRVPMNGNFDKEVETFAYSRMSLILCRVDWLAYIIVELNINGALEKISLLCFSTLRALEVAMASACNFIGSSGCYNS